MFVNSAGMVLKLGIASVALVNGVVAEQGAPQELYAQNGLYTHMADLQTGAQNRTI